MTTVGPLLTVSIVIALACLGLSTAATLLRAVRAGGRRDDPAVHDGTLLASRFGSSVSVIVPVMKTIDGVARTIASALALEHGDLEVVVVTSDVEAPDLDLLKAEWELTAREFFYRHLLPTSQVRRIYRSGRDPRLILVDKAPGSYADALNCGVNLARGTYVLAIEPDVRFNNSALVRTMSAVCREPGIVSGITAHVERRPASGVVRGNLAAGLQWLESIRAFADARLGRRVGMALREVAVIWRRETVLRAGGFSERAKDPHFDLMLRLRTRQPDAQPERVLHTSEMFGWAPPTTAARHRTRRVLGRRAAIDSVLTDFRNRDSEAETGVLESLLAPLAAGWIVIGTVIGVLTGVLTWTSLVAALVVLAFGTGVLGAAALLVRGSTIGAPEDKDLTTLLLLTPFERALRVLKA